jgi:hypothetical protein
MSERSLLRMVAWCILGCTGSLRCTCTCTCGSCARCNPRRLRVAHLLLGGLDRRRLALRARACALARELSVCVWMIRRDVGRRPQQRWAGRGAPQIDPSANTVSDSSVNGRLAAMPNTRRRCWTLAVSAAGQPASPEPPLLVSSLAGGRLRVTTESRHLCTLLLQAQPCRSPQTQRTPNVSSAGEGW